MQSRRGFMGLGAAGLLAFAGSPALARVPSLPRRKLSFLNLHTGERLKATYWADGAYRQDALREIDHVLRDHRTGDVAEMDRRLLDLLFHLHARMDSTEPFHIISGYRSPRSNAMLASKSRGVAKKSLHMRAMAVDIRLPGRDLRQLRKTALAMKAGGVGYYPKSGFIHVDVGRVRHW